MNATPVSVAVRYSLGANFAPAHQQRSREQLADEAFRLTAEGWRLAQLGEHAQAEQFYRKAFATDSVTYLKHVGRQDLVAGNYQRDPVLKRPSGWAILAAHPSVVWHGAPVPPRWDGNSVDTLLVTPDDGLGDQIMLARFIPQLKARGVGRIVVMAQKPLARLFSRLSDVDDVWPIEYNIRRGVIVPSPRFQVDARVNMNALPRIFGTQVDSIPGTPYISADAVDVEHWRPRMPTGLRVGLAWRTSPVAKQAARRSFPLATLAPLWTVPGVGVVSLQKGDGEDEARSFPLPLANLGSEFRDVADTAAVISQLDLVIGTDVCALNVAGAMGVPTWVLTDPTPDFRWLHRWYPTGRIFSQQTPGDWRGPVEAAARALAELCESR